MQLCSRELAASVLFVQLLALHELNRSTLVQDSMSMCSNLYRAFNDLFGNSLGWVHLTQALNLKANPSSRRKICGSQELDSMHALC
jgi:hypothetical protein